MAVSTGIDIVHIPTFTHSLQNGGQIFKDKLFAVEEQSAFTAIESLAGIYSAKEAIIKAMNDRTLTPSSIRISKDISGKPRIIQPILDATTIDISISHDGDYAVAICVILKP